MRQHLALRPFLENCVDEPLGVITQRQEILVLPGAQRARGGVGRFLDDVDRVHEESEISHDRISPSLSSMCIRSRSILAACSSVKSLAFSGLPRASEAWVRPCEIRS